MGSLPDALAAAVAAITAMGGLGAAAFGLTDATKAFGGGISNVGFGAIIEALKPFEAALAYATPNWQATLRANWVNGVDKDLQKTTAKSLIRLGIADGNLQDLAAAGHVDPDALQKVLAKLKAGAALTPQDAELFGRLNAVIDAAMDAGFELGDQRYRNASKLVAGVLAVILAVSAGYLTQGAGLPGPLVAAKGQFVGSPLFWWSILVGLVAVPVAPVAKDLASSLQAAGAAVGSLKR
jgi:hypothetical protein